MVICVISCFTCYIFLLIMSIRWFTSGFGLEMLRISNEFVSSGHPRECERMDMLKRVGYVLSVIQRDLLHRAASSLLPSWPGLKYLPQCQAVVWDKYIKVCSC